MELSYKGTCFHGWQSQVNAETVQTILEDSLFTITGESIKTIGAGRTDSGVHAKYFTAHFNGKSEVFQDRDTFLYKINSVLPSDIAIFNIRPVKAEAHARYSALSRTYEYTISKIKDPFMTDYSWIFTRPLDLHVMNQASAILLKYQDFTSFSKLHSNVKTNICRIIHAGWEETGNLTVFRIQADRFLRNMVRAIVGSMIHLGTGRIDLQQYIQIIESKNRSLVPASAPAQGLALIEVSYPEDIFL